MKEKNILILLFLSLTISSISQTNFDITDNPIVDRQYYSPWGNANIIRIAISNNTTIVVWEYISAKRIKNGWISMSSRTTLYSPQMFHSEKIIDWGLIDDIGETHKLEFDQHYDVTSDRRYVLYMIFSAIPSNVNKFDISENVEYGLNGFEWEGIHINERINNQQSKNFNFSNNISKFSSNNSDIQKVFSYNNPHNPSYNEGPTISDNFIATSSGTCFAVNSEGYLVTCYHVIEEAKKIRIRGLNGNFEKSYSAKVISIDKDNDIALLKIVDPHFTSLDNIPYSIQLNDLEVGDDVFVLGYPLRVIMGDEIKLTDGIISSKTGFQGDITCYQITATVQAGNSGGPLFDKKGHIVGIIGSRLFVENATYAVKSKYLREIIISNNVVMPMENMEMMYKSLSEQVKEMKKFVYIVEIQE